MASQAQYLDDKRQKPVPRSPARPAHANGNTAHSKKAVAGYTSVGVQNHDIFSLPSSDWQLLGLVTLLGAVVRLFRLSQPSSVVFDEVQYAQSQSKKTCFRSSC